MPSVDSKVQFVVPEAGTNIPVVAVQELPVQNFPSIIRCTETSTRLKPTWAKAVPAMVVSVVVDPLCVRFVMAEVAGAAVETAWM